MTEPREAWGDDPYYYWSPEECVADRPPVDWIARRRRRARIYVAVFCLLALVSVAH